MVKKTQVSLPGLIRLLVRAGFFMIDGFQKGAEEMERLRILRLTKGLSLTAISNQLSRKVALSHLSKLLGTTTQLGDKRPSLWLYLELVYIIENAPFKSNRYGHLVPLGNTMDNF